MTLALGLMSGTSCDGISAALVEFQDRRFRLLGSQTFAYPAPVPQVLHRVDELSTGGVAQLHVLLGELFGWAALRLLRQARVSPNAVAVIGSHGHTVYHGPDDPIPSTLQLGDPSIIAERTGCCVVADFRTRDVAAGGQGAPLVPFFDDYFFGGGPPRALQNLGGIANVTVVGRRVTPLAFDTGPGNCLIDAAMRRISRGQQTFDAGGRRAARGRIDEAAVRQMWAHPYFRLPPPKSTGRELLDDRFLTDVFGRRWARPHDVLATVTYFTAFSVTESYRRFVPVGLREVIVSGGGVKNRTLMAHLRRLLHPLPVRSIERYGLPAQAKEPVAFAFLALRALQGCVNHLPSTTGASGPRVLGTFTR